MSDLRVRRGLERQLEARRELIAGGRAPLGWKAGFGAPESLERFGLAGPLVGFMTDASLIDDGAEVDISDWGRAVAEPELAVHLGQDLPVAGGETATRAAIHALGPAIELADIDPPSAEVEEVLAGNIFHKGVILGTPDPDRRGGELSGLEARVRLGDQELVRTNRLEDMTGRLVEVIAHLSGLLADHGETMRAGEVVICGSVIPPIDLSPGTSVRFELYPMEPISVTVR